MNVGYEEEELKPYIEPQPDYKDPRRTGVQLNIKKDYFPQISVISQVKSKPLLCADIMLTMGYSQEEIKDSLVNQKYNEVMATYLLLDYKNSEVPSFVLKTDVNTVLLSVLVKAFLCNTSIRPFVFELETL